MHCTISSVPMWMRGPRRRHRRQCPRRPDQRRSRRRPRRGETPDASHQAAVVGCSVNADQSHQPEVSQSGTPLMVRPRTQRATSKRVLHVEVDRVVDLDAVAAALNADAGCRLALGPFERSSIGSPAKNVRLQIEELTRGRPVHGGRAVVGTVGRSSRATKIWPLTAPLPLADGATAVPRRQPHARASDGTEPEPRQPSPMRVSSRSPPAAARRRPAPAPVERRRGAVAPRDLQPSACCRCTRPTRPAHVREGRARAADGTSPALPSISISSVGPDHGRGQRASAGCRRRRRG